MSRMENSYLFTIDQCDDSCDQLNDKVGEFIDMLMIFAAFEINCSLFLKADAGALLKKEHLLFKKTNSLKSIYGVQKIMIDSRANETFELHDAAIVDDVVRSENIAPLYKQFTSIITL